MASLIYADYLMVDRKFNEAETLLKSTFMYNKNNGKPINLS
jgi:hypothetical protein